MANSNATKRLVERVPADIPVTFEVLIPENTFSARQYTGRVCNISERGAMIIVDLDPEIGPSLLHKTRYCRVCFEEPKLPDRIVGRAVWIQPEKEKLPGRDRFRIGVFFEDCSEEQQTIIRRYVAELMSLRHK